MLLRCEYNTVMLLELSVPSTEINQKNHFLMTHNIFNLFSNI